MRRLVVLVALLLGPWLAGCSEPVPTPRITQGPLAVGEDGLPLAFPRAEVPLPVGEAADAFTPARGRFALTLTVPDDAAAVVAGLDATMRRSGFRRLDEGSDEGDGADALDRAYESPGWVVEVGVQQGGVARPRQQQPAGTTRLTYRVEAR
ncbi:hypothetical protein [Nocardioides solisilvae]|uniref:hypothetical protein n=1 Tax=Nocardioides solisilvae TaxID=1542435 RepID=UPI000D742392|nr:hypothetical protein [Nocardioides solisilvae]